MRAYLFAIGDGERYGAQVNGQRSMDEVFAEIGGVLSAFTEDESPAQQR